MTQRINVNGNGSWLVLRPGVNYKEPLHMANLPRLAKPQNPASGHNTMYRIHLPTTFSTRLPARE
jgi:hypothetical protein